MKPRVLLVDDTEFGIKLLIASLKFRYEVSSAKNGQEAIDILRDATEPYSAVLMDVEMPIMGGIEATRIIRAELGMTSLPIIAITGHALKSDEDSFLRCGMSDYISKPIDLKMLLDKLSKWTGHALDGRQAEKSSTGIEIKANKQSFPDLNVDSILMQIGGNEELLHKMLETFNEDFHSAAKDIERHLNRHEYEDAKVVVHTLKSVAGTLFFNDIFENCKKLEVALKTNEIIEATAINKKMDEQLELALRKIEAYLSPSR